MKRQKPLWLACEVSVPEAVAGIALLSDGQASELSTARLRAPCSCTATKPRRMEPALHFALSSGSLSVLGYAIHHLGTRVLSLWNKRPATLRRPNLSTKSPLVDFDHLPSGAPWWHADALICTLGTTLSKAGSKEAFQRVDHGYPLQAGRLAHQHGTPTYVLNSALGANASSRIFYNRVKGELERDLALLQFSSLTHVRPGLIGGDRTEVRTGERATASVLRLLGPVLPRRWRLNPAEKIAEVLLEAAIHPLPGVRAIASEHMC